MTEALQLSLLFAALIALISSGSAKQHEFDVFSLEKGKVIHESIISDKETRVVRIKMPAHNGLDSIESLLDYTRGLHVKYFPDTKKCIVGKLDRKVFMEPEYMESALHATQGRLWTKDSAIVEKSMYRSMGKFDHMLMTPAMKDLCGDSEPMWGEEVLPSQIIDERDGIIFVKDQQNVRTKRQIHTTKCVGDDRASACLLTNQFCHWISICSKAAPNERRVQESTCDGEHNYGKGICCTPCCANPLRSDRKTPACSLMTDPKELKDSNCGSRPQDKLVIIEKCNPNPCHNGATCIQGISRYECHCAEGYEGRNCDTVKRCSRSPCRNGGHCRKGSHGPICSCINGYSGNHCDVQDKCTPNPCTGNAPRCHTFGTVQVCMSIPDCEYNPQCKERYKNQN